MEDDDHYYLVDGARLSRHEYERAGGNLVNDNRDGRLGPFYATPRWAIEGERKRLRAEGFRGVPLRTVYEVDDGTHFVRVVEYSFPENPGGGTSLFVEVAETHDGARPARILPLSSVVHVLQNVSDAERWALEAREVRP